MLSRFPLWKYGIIALILFFSVLYALPNLYPDQPVVQITRVLVGQPVEINALEKAKDALAQSEITDVSLEVNPKKTIGTLIFKSVPEQIRAKDIIQKTLAQDYVVAVNLVSKTPDWLLSLGATPMKLGLDLRGGVHFLLAVDIQKALDQRLITYRDEIADLLVAERIRYRSVSQPSSSNVQDDGSASLPLITVAFSDTAQAEKAVEILKTLREFQIQLLDTQVKLQISPQAIQRIREHAISQNLTTLRNRVNELGVSEPLVQKQGSDRIVVELPGVQDTAQAKRIIGRTANLEFRLVDKNASLSGSSLSGESFPLRQAPNQKTVLERRIIATGDQVLDAQSGFDENGQPEVSINLDSKGGNQMQRITSAHVGDAMAVLFVEQKTELKSTLENGGWVQKPITTEEKTVINQANIQGVFGNRFRITGLDSPQESSELALLLRAGALAAPMYFIEESTIGPSLGQQNINDGLKSFALGAALVFLCMLVVYRIFGIFANIALLLNVVLMTAILSLFSATLTLPGIAGIVLTMGMAVDANVLIHERIKEELRKGALAFEAIEAGYDRAFITILDSNLTTLIIALILFVIGTGPIKGFAVTLGVGILTSMFTSVVVTRALVSLVYGGKSIHKVHI
ncbi:MAG: protein translocase subunit SecD [Pseudomonadota bacterium]